jgi:hypothetical protein
MTSENHREIPFFTPKPRFFRGWRIGSIAQNRVTNFSHFARQQHRLCDGHCAHHAVFPHRAVSVHSRTGHRTRRSAVPRTLGGYCDERGCEEYNLALGQKRGDSAKKNLLNAGVAASRIRVISYGKEKPFCTQSTQACWQQNRRAGFTLDR